MKSCIKSFLLQAIIDVIAILQLNRMCKDSLDKEISKSEIKFENKCSRLRENI